MPDEREGQRDSGKSTRIPQESSGKQACGQSANPIHEKPEIFGFIKFRTIVIFILTESICRSVSPSASDSALSPPPCFPFSRLFSVKSESQAESLSVAPVIPQPLDGFLPESFKQDEESLRRGRLQVRFGVYGGAMAVVYSALFFYLIHPWGGAIVALSGLAIMAVPWIVQKTGNLSLAGHVYGSVLMIGLTALCAVSGGLQGSAYAWMAAVPACALLLMNLRGALIWSGICVAVVITYAALDFAQVGFLKLYPPETENMIEAAGSIALVLFLAFMALLFEKSRVEAFERLQVANAKLAVVNRELVDLNRQKNEFLNIAANDLKNPLSIICDYADLLKELESPTLEDIQGRATDILRSGTVMLDTIRNILDVRRIEDGKVSLSQRRCDLAGPISELILRYEVYADEKGINLDNTIGPNAPEAYADPDAVRQVIDQLLSNAIKFTEPEGSVWISLVLAAKEVVIEVSDTGPGLSREEQAQLWGKFVRLSPQPTGGENSVGLGLWIVKRLVEAMHGRVLCRSVERGGSTFIVRLPLWMEQEEIIVEPTEEIGGFEDGAPAFERLLADIQERAEAKARATGGKSDDIALPG